MVGTLRRLSKPAARNLQFVSACGAGPTTIGAAAVASATATKLIFRHPVVFGSGDCSHIVLSFFAWYLQKLVGVTALGNGFGVEKISFEYGGVSKPVTFSGGRTLTVAAGDTDIKADELAASAFGATFTQGSTGYVCGIITFSTPATDKFPQNSYPKLTTTASAVLYDPAKCNITNGVDSTGVITYAMTGGGVDGTDAKAVTRFFTPIVLGKFVSASRLPVFITIGDSIAEGLAANDTVTNAMFAAGYTRDFFPNGVSSGAGAIANLNMGCSGGFGSDWANGAPGLLTSYLQYAKYAFESYGANSATLSMSTAIHAQLRAANIAHIIRASITPYTSSTDTWATAANQTAQSGYSNAGAIGTFHAALKALVTTDYTYVDPLGWRDTDYWKWFANGVAAYAVHSDGLHPTSVGYELQADGSTEITASGGVTTGTIRALFASMT